MASSKLLSFLGALLLACSAACDSGETGGGAPGGAVPPEVIIRGASAESAIGASFGAAGDFDGDGHADLVLGAPGDGFISPGSAFIARGPFASAETTLDEGNSIQIVAEQLEHVVGSKVQGVGDFDGDGLGDVVVSATSACIGTEGCFHDCPPATCTEGPIRSYLGIRCTDPVLS